MKVEMQRVQRAIGLSSSGATAVTQLESRCRTQTDGDPKKTARTFFTRGLRQRGHSRKLENVCWSMCFPYHRRIASNKVQP
jgi:hypothetical protein